jgi:hypothetical protein
LWNWSLNGNHDVLALIAGLTFPPLAVAAVWLLALTIAGLLTRVISHSADRSSSAARRRRLRGRRQPRPSTANTVADSTAAAAQARADARKLAA